MKKGFTLVELIVSISLLTIIGLVIGINLKKTSKVSNFENLSDDIQTYFYLNKNKDTYKYYYSSSDELTSCIKMSTLLDYGIINESDLTSLTKNDIVKIKQDTDGLIKDYEIVTNNQEECNYLKSNIEGSVKNDNVDINNNGSDEYNITQTITESELKHGVYDSTITFNASLFKEIVKPVYVLIMLDKSGSMISNDSKKDALKAINSMINNIYDIDNSYLGFIPFSYNENHLILDNSIWFTKEYKSQVLNNVSNVKYGGDNNYYEAYNTAINTYKITDMKDYFTYVVLLSDAGNNNDGTTCLYSANKNNIAAKIKDNTTKFIAVAYKPATSCLNDIASNNCGNDNNEKCFYLSDSSNVASIFNDISTKIKSDTTLKSVKIEIKISDYFDVDEENLNKDNIKYSIDSKGNKYLTIIYDLSNKTGNNYNLNLDYSLIFLPKKYESSNTGAENVYLADSMKFNFTYENNNYEKIIDKANLPYVTIKTSEDSAIN